MHGRYTTDEERIVAEVLEGEVMVVDLTTGHYFVMEGTGADLWLLMAHGTTVSEAAAAMSGRYSADVAEIETAAIDFVNQLVAEDLIEPVADDAATNPPEFPDIAERRPFALPAMYKYTDMANLVQMDPIRDFDDSRWPRRRSIGKKPR